MRRVDASDYDIRRTGHPLLHRNLAWYATDDDRVLGVVIEDLVDHDYSWVVLTQNEQGPGYTAIDLDHSLTSVDAATAALHAAMVGESNA